MKVAVAERQRRLEIARFGSLLTAPFPGAVSLVALHDLDVLSDGFFSRRGPSLERWIHVAKLLRAYGGCLGVRSR